MLFAITYQKLFVPSSFGFLKTETRRRIKFGEQRIIYTNGEPTIYESGKPKYWIGKREAVRAGWSEQPIAYIVIDDLGVGDVRGIDNLAIKREGFSFYYQFITRWAMMHDKDLYIPTSEKEDNKLPKGTVYNMMKEIDKREGKDALRYYAWTIRFHVETDSLKLFHPRMQPDQLGTTFNWDDYYRAIAFEADMPDRKDVDAYFNWLFPDQYKGVGEEANFKRTPRKSDPLMEAFKQNRKKTEEEQKGNKQYGDRSANALPIRDL